VSDAEPNQVLGISFRNSKAGAERYHREQYPQIQDTLKHLLETDPVIRTFDVQASTTQELPHVKPPKGTRQRKESALPARFLLVHYLTEDSLRVR